MVKNLVNRDRPLTYNSNVPLEERMNAMSRESFFSGYSSHSAAASIFFAKVINDYHSDLKNGVKVGLWSTMLTIPAVTAYLSVKAGRHFPSDAIVGYLVGGAIGYFVPHLHKIQSKKSTGKVSLTPVVGPGYATLSMRIKL